MLGLWIYDDMPRLGRRRVEVVLPGVSFCGESSREEELGNGWVRSFFDCPKCLVPEMLVIETLMWDDEEAYYEEVRVVSKNCGKCGVKFMNGMEPEI